MACINIFVSPDTPSFLPQSIPSSSDAWNPVWTALEAEGLGCNLQHYNPLIDVRIQTEWNVPTTWNLKSQLVFGTPRSDAPLKEKIFSPLEDRIKVYGAES